jgi:hypothetical protein
MDYENHLKELRASYYRSYPRQRVNIVKQRIENPEHGPNLLVTYVSGIEGLLRSLVVWGETNSGRPSAEIYEKYRMWGVDRLYKEYLKQKCSEPVVDDELYQLISFAVEYRNLLAHECTYLGQDKFPKLIEACDAFLKSICTHENIEYS